MKNAINSAWGRSVVIATVILSSVGMASVASATAYSPTTDATALGDSAGTMLGPVVVAVFGAVLGVLILFWAVKFVRRLIGGGHG